MQLDGDTLANKDKIELLWRTPHVESLMEEWASLQVEWAQYRLPCECLRIGLKALRHRGAPRVLVRDGEAGHNYAPERGLTTSLRGVEEHL